MKLKLFTIENQSFHPIYFFANQHERDAFFEKMLASYRTRFGKDTLLLNLNDVQTLEDLKNNIVEE